MSAGAVASAQSAEPSAAVERATLDRVGRRLLPLLFFLFIAAFVDRTNVGLASPSNERGARSSARPYTAWARESSSSATLCSRCRATSFSHASERGDGSDASR